MTPESGSDRTPPVLDAIRFDPPQIADGGVTTLLIQAHDDMSGVTRVTGNFSSPNGAALLSFDCYGDEASGLFSARITIPGKGETGVWFVSNLFIVDGAQNPLIGRFTAATVPPGGSLVVSSAESDSAPPEVRDIRLDQGSLRDGEKNLIRIEVVDDRSGVASVDGSFQSPARSAHIAFICARGADLDIWESEVTLPANADCGEWTMQQLRVADNAGNRATLGVETPLVARAGFRVMTRDCDDTAPTLDSLDLSPAVVSNDTAAEILVTAILHDVGTGVESASGWVSGPAATNGQAPVISFACTSNSRDPEAPWTCKIPVPQFAARGTWAMQRFRVTDKARNARDYLPDDRALVRATFEVQ